MSFLDRLKSHRLFRRTPNCSPISTADSKTAELSQAGDDMASVPPEKETRVKLLTPREYDLYLLLLEGYTLKECAARIGVKYSTANTHMTGIYRKLGVRSRAELIIGYRSVT